MKPIIFLGQSGNRFLIIATLTILSAVSCNESNKSSETTANSDSISIAKTPDSISTPGPKEAADSTDKQKGGYVDLKVLCATVNSYYYKKNFVKFIFIPYQRDQNDNVRLFCYALSKNLSGEEANEIYRIGKPFFISLDGSGEDPGTLISKPEKLLGLSLTNKQMDTIFKMDPSSCMNLNLVPEKRGDTDGNYYTTFHVFKNSRDTKIVLNPSPPGKK